MHSHKTKTIDYRKVLQITAVYLFALVCAVACGQSFAPSGDPNARLKPSGSGDRMAPNGGETVAKLAIELAVSKAPKTEDKKYFEITYTITQGHVGALVATHHQGGDQSHGDSEKGDVKFRVEDQCLDLECKRIVALVTRLDKDGKQAQTAILLQAKEGSESAYARVKTADQTSFPKGVMDAQKALGVAPVPAPSTPPAGPSATTPANAPTTGAPEGDPAASSPADHFEET